MKLKVPPGIVAVVCAIIMWVIYENLSSSSFYFSLPLWIPMGIGAIGGLLGLSALIQFYFNKTSVDPHQPDKVGTLVRDGPYRFSRNPMYLGLLLMLFAWDIYLGDSLALTVLPLFIWFMNQFQIKPEEKILEQKFGVGYRSYKHEVRRWI